MISVCMAVHNGELFLKEQIDSILIQLGDNDEIVISDDGSIDQSLEILKSYKDTRIKLVTSSTRNNHVKNFETTLTVASGDLIFLADQDDIWEPEKVNTMTQCLRQYPLVISDCYVINDKGEELSDSLFNYYRSGKGILKNCLKNTYVGCCMAFTREVLNKALPFPSQLKAHDQWIGLIAEKYFDVLFLPTQLIKYRRHSNNFSQTGEKSKLKALEQISYRFTLLKNLVLHNSHDLGFNSYLPE